MRKFFVIIVGIFLTTIFYAQEEISLEFNTIRYGELRTGGFNLNNSKEVHIEALGGGYEAETSYYKVGFEDEQGMFIYAWIIDAESRELVWQMTNSNTQSMSGSPWLRKFSGQVNLPAGRYEVYFNALEPRKFLHKRDGFPSLGELLQRLLRGDNWQERNIEDCYLKIQSVDEVYSAVQVRDYHNKRRQNAVVSLTDVYNSDIKDARFTLTEEGEFKIYALGETLDGEEYDYGWILNVDAGHKVWEMVEENSQHAGGAFKNRIWKTQIKLNSGDYWVRYVTDDSHSPQRWNANPPNDPVFWGLTITGVPGQYDPNAVQEFRGPDFKPVVNLTRVGNNQYVEEGLEFTEETTVQITAIGEGRDGEMFDYGWIVNARTDQIVWEMTYDKTRHAGGAHKNRMIEETVVLPPGRYWVYYMTDDSHAYGSWNSEEPRQPSRWGITVKVNEADLKSQKVRRAHEKSTQLIVDISKIRDNEFVQEAFEIKKETTLKIFALGEGRDGEMYDYGWIVDGRTGKRIWTMDYYKTKPAGGAQKNRMVDTEITLLPGTYIVYYKSDGSHSFGDWNATSPRQPHRWGISIYLIDGDTESIKPLPEATIEQSSPLIELTDIYNDELVHKSFAIEKGMSIRIVAIGEGSGGRMVDYGWIINSATGKKVWNMDYHHTHNAGGSHKNRLTDEVIYLPAGSYTVYFRTDNSHAYNSWNARPPDDPSHWGIRIFPAERDFDTSKFKIQEELGTRGNVISQIIRVRNYEHLKKTFKLEKNTRVRISAIGEGSWEEMYDYGWIENRHTKEVVWIMSYDQTHWAGGARKNRGAELIRELPAGEYILHFISDDSHSYHNWNAPPPTDEGHYGITLYKVENQ